MSVAPPSPLRARLRAIPPERARLQTALIAALNSREVDGLSTTARLASARDRRAARAWIDFKTDGGRVAVAPLLVEGGLAQLTRGGAGPDAAAAAALLEQVEGLIAAVETALGTELQPSGLSETVDEGASVLLRLDGSAAQAGIRHRLIVAVPTAMEAAPLPLPTRMPGVVSRLRPRWSARIPGPAIPAERAARIGKGDLILLGPAPLVAKLSLPGRNDFPHARVLWAERQLAVEATTGETVLDGTGNQAGTEPDWTAVSLPSVIELDGAGLTAAELAGIGKGSVLPLPAQGGTLAVRVRIGDTLFATGELVAVGEGFGVLVTGLLDSGADRG